ncbi:MAG: fatty acid/phospholipid synthesis protein PlsX [Deltaproteobacteria bacterium]|jgi:glycerol-3-phosphate acyltransferase PlsX|nr:fatty acid/phospholipid synthesis protein PlsX [Deltaproteobacteria bacterium]
MPKIAVDAMGGDHAPAVVVEGALLAAQDVDAELILVGDKLAVEQECLRIGGKLPRFPIINATQTVSMDESPSVALRKRDSSMKVAFEMIKRGEAEAVVSAGNSGAMMAIGMLVIGTLPQVTRPAILAIVPGTSKGTIIIDAGANVDCKPRQLLQFGIIGSVYAERGLGIVNPRVGVLSNGEEDSKGNELTRAASELLDSAPVNYVGYVEGRDFFNGKVDVIVCDGFTGNVALKTMEGVASFAGEILKSGFEKSWLSRLGYLLTRHSLRHAYRKLDYAEYGGARLLGLDGVAIVAHGGSTALAIKNAIRVASESVSQNVNGHISAALESMAQAATENKTLLTTIRP